MRLVFTPHGWQDYIYWLTADRTTHKRINRLIDAALREPAAGIGKPEPLRHVLSGAWLRRITDEHRLVYLVEATTWSFCRRASTTSSARIFR